MAEGLDEIGELADVVIEVGGADEDEAEIGFDGWVVGDGCGPGLVVEVIDGFDNHFDGFVEIGEERFWVGRVGL